MRIWIDGDACPVAVKEIVFRAANRTKIPLTVVANQPMRIPRSEFITILTVPSGLNVADQKIVELLDREDLVVTADIPLAALVVEKGACAIDPRGELYTLENIGERLAMRNLMDELRGSGAISGGPPPFRTNDSQSFANQLDRLLAKRRRKT
ncbi:YaiI/YqxD family protein [Schlesneria paludicola]|uniref:YaiI/YqxD family protein n=1 Tax=Schlesneria paludicola TaxID=360056 RepID=UPI00029A4AEE|nr:YaiI/YqxD family protein [Schlesneria paludicola]